MNKLSEQLEPYKKAVIESFGADGVYDYDDALSNFVVVEPDVLQTDELVLDECEMMSMLGKGTKKKTDFDDSGIMIEYVRLSEFVSPLERDELIEGLMKKSAIREIEAKYSYSLHLKEKIIDELRTLHMSDLFICIDSSDYFTICRSTGEIGFYYEATEGEDYDNYEVEQLFTKICDYNLPEKNIFSGFQFHEVTIRYVTDEEYAEWRRYQEEYEEYQSEQGEQGDFEPGDDFPF